MTVESAALAQPSPSADGDAAKRQRAAELYDEAVSLYEHAKYAEAARAFFDADELVPSSDALGSSIAAARLAHDDLLVALAAQRASAREGVDPKLAGDARAALSEAETHLARLELSCEPSPCALNVDGKSSSAGRIYLLPGTHELSARLEATGEVLGQRATLAAGSLYTITLGPAARDAAPARADTRDARTSTSIAVAGGAAKRDNGARRAKPLPPWVLYVGVGGSVALGAVTAWSGTDALKQVDHYKQTRLAGDRDQALSSVHRTDWLLAGTLVLAGATTYAAFRLVELGSGAQSVSVMPQPGGAWLGWSGKL